MNETGGIGLSGKYLPFHPAPMAEELFSSWLYRVAKGNHPKLHTFCHLNWPKRQIWTRDIDQCADKDLVRDLAELTGTLPSDAQKTLLSSFQGSLFEKHQPNGRTLGILPLGVFHRLRKRYGQQYCPRCLANDRVPYFRKSWRLTHVTSCLEHGIRLVDRCDDCGAPIIFFRGDMLVCHNCGFDLRCASRFIAGTQVKWFEARNRLALQRGYTWLGSNKIEVSIAYFDIIRQLLRILSFGARSQGLRETVAKRFGGDPSPIKEDEKTTARKFEHLSTHSRYRITELLSPLVQHWPEAFIDTCQASRNFSSQLLKDMPFVRYHLWMIAKNELSGSPVHPDRR